MRILHTSDWHLGRSLHSHPRTDEQAAFLRQIGVIARERDVDALVISGDVYDRSVPPLEAVQQLERALVDLTDVCPVVMIAGNHDSPRRLGFASPLLEKARLHLRASVADLDRPVEIEGADGIPLAIYGLPFLHPDEHHEHFNVERSHRAVLSAAMDRVRADLERRDSRSLVLAHAFIVGGRSDAPDSMVESDSERDLRVGGIGEAPVSVFEGVDYVALGHLHGAQSLRTEGSLRAAYSGSPMAFSFSEERHVKAVTLVDIPAAGPVTLEQIPIPVLRPLVTIRGSLEEILTSAEFDMHRESWVRAIYTDPRRISNASGQVGTRFTFAVDTVHAPEGGLGADGQVARADVTSADPLEVVSDFIRYATDTEPDPRERALVTQAYDRVRARAETA